MTIRFDSLACTIQTLKASLDMLRGAEEGSRQYDVCRNAVFGSFEICLKSSEALLQKLVTETPGRSARFPWPQLVQKAVGQELILEDEAERWVGYKETCHCLLCEDDAGITPDFLLAIEVFYKDAGALLDRVVRLQKEDAL